jgi:CubicO group peptidase (beta-lactamase class C family)
LSPARDKTEVESLTARALGALVAPSPSASVAVGIALGREAHVRINPGRDAANETSLYEVGSLTKPMAALLLATMVIAGEIALSDPIDRHLGRVPNGQILVGDLASHTAGLRRLPRNIRRLTKASPEDPYRHVDDAALIEGLSISGHLVPGQYRYSNFGYMVLARVLEAAGAGSLEDLLRDRVFTPLAMARTTLEPTALGPPSRLYGYDRGLQVGHWTRGVPGSGGIEAPVGDLLRFAVATLRPDSSPLGSAVRLTLEARAQVDDDGGTIGLGWLRRRDGVIWHLGRSGGFRAFVAVQPARDLAVVALTNVTNQPNAVVLELFSSTGEAPV